LKIDLNLVAADLLAAQELIARARRLAQAFGEELPGTFVNLYTAGSLGGADVWILRAWVGGQSVRSPHVPTTGGTLGELTAQQEPLVFSGSGLSREDYAHLDVRRTLRSLAYLPLKLGGALSGVVEILSFESELSPEELPRLQPLLRIGAAAVVAALSYETERNDSLASVTRLTQLYDLERSFSSTLDMDELLPLISSKLREVMECAAINLWLLEGDESIRRMHER